LSFKIPAAIKKNSDKKITAGKIFCQSKKSKNFVEVFLQKFLNFFTSQVSDNKKCL